MKTIQTLIVVSVCACSFIAPTRSRSAEAQADSSTTAPPVVTPADKVRMAQAARVDCYAQLVEQIKGLKVSDNSTVLDAASQYIP